MNDEARALAQRWVDKAEHDWETCQLMAAQDPCRADVVCFHYQQYVEKLLKGLLTLHAIESPKTHDLRRLCQLALPAVPGLSSLLDKSDALTVHAVESRYPDLPEPTEAQMRAMQSITEEFAALLLPQFSPAD